MQKIKFRISYDETTTKKKKPYPKDETGKNKRETESGRCREHKKSTNNNKQIISVD